MSTRKRKLSKEEIAAAFAEGSGMTARAALSPLELANILGYSVKTIYEWKEKGHFDGAYRKRGKHIRFWRDRAVEIFFNGKEWT